MDVLGAYLDDRQAQASNGTDADLRWMRERGGIDPAERLVKWERWLRQHLRSTLQWPDDQAKREKLIGQCMAEITTMVRRLRGRGWLLEGDALAAHVTALLQPIAAAQAAGKVGSFWPYFVTSVKGYVGSNAEEIQLHARRTGADESTVSIGTALAGLHLKGASLTELITDAAQEAHAAKSLRERTRAARRQDRCKGDARQGQLL